MNLRDIFLAGVFAQGGGGLNATASALLITILRNVSLYATDQSGNITALATELGVTEEEVPDEPDGPDEPDVPEVVKYTITNKLTNVTNSNSVASVEENASYSANLAASEGYELDTVTVTMGGMDITATAYASGVVTIGAVTGNVVITAVAVASGSEAVAVAMLDEIEINGIDKAYFYSDDSLAANQVDTVKDMLKANGTNFNWFSDAGNTAVSDNSLTTRSSIYCQTSQNVFSEDTELKVLIHNGKTNAYDNYIIGCTNWDGVSAPSATDVFYCQSLGTNAWHTNADHEVSYTVKAGYRFFIASYASNGHRVFLIPVGTELTSVAVTQASYVSFSEAVFDEDATVRITASSSGQKYGSVWACCIDSDGTTATNRNGYYTQKLDSQGWKKPYSFEGTYEVKAGYRLGVLSHWSRSEMDEFKVEVA